MSEFIIDVEEAKKLFRTICGIAEESSDEMTRVGKGYDRRNRCGKTGF